MELLVQASVCLDDLKLISRLDRAELRWFAFTSRLLRMNCVDIINLKQIVVVFNCQSHQQEQEGHANLLCIVPILSDVSEETSFSVGAGYMNKNNKERSSDVG
ncbi:hypothetical protein ACLOJK_009681 [Asimina triloba]